VLEKSSERPPEKRLPSVARAAASPTAIVLAGAGVVVGEAAHLGLAIAVVLGAAGYGARVAWAAVHRRVALRQRALRLEVRIDPWAVPEPWRGYTVRAVDARRRLRQLAVECPVGPVASYLANAATKVESAVEEEWALARSGAALVGPGGQSEKVAQELARVQGSLRQSQGAERTVLGSQEAALASELRSLRHTEAVSTQMSSQLAALCAQLESLVAGAALLVGAAGTAEADLSQLSSELDSLSGALEEARRIMATSPPAD
jgi:hypothetical protein